MADLISRYKNSELWDFHARRIVEMVGNIIITYLLLNDAQRDAQYLPSAEIFSKKAMAQNHDKMNYIKDLNADDLLQFRIVD